LPHLPQRRHHRRRGLRLGRAQAPQRREQARDGGVVFGQRARVREALGAGAVLVVRVGERAQRARRGGGGRGARRVGRQQRQEVGGEADLHKPCGVREVVEG
jgi:hypothetical protein